jgi:aminodeoxyfutalosine synthase
MIDSELHTFLSGTNQEPGLKKIGEKVIAKERISDEDGLLLFERASLAFSGLLANHIREEMHGDKTFFNRNFHIEPTNFCVFACKFCS